MDDKSFNPQMLTLAREYKGLTQEELGEKIGAAQSVVSRMENGTLPITIEYAQKFSEVLERPIGFFSQTARIVGLGGSFLFHRKRQSMPVKAVRQAEAAVNIRRIQIERLMHGIEAEHEYEFNQMDVGIDGSPEEIARLVRASWRLPSGPIRNLTTSIERAGAIVLRMRFESQQVDGISLWVNGTPPIIFLNSHIPADRDRWSIAHELGHIVMHRKIHQGIEDEADRFAAELLMPASDIRHELSGMTIAKAASMKLTWRTSIQAIIRRAFALEQINQRRYRYLFMQLSRLGYRTNEPNDFPKEESHNLPSIIGIHIDRHGYTPDDLAAITQSNREEFKSVYMGNNQSLRLAN